MPRNEKTHGESLAAIRAFIANDPLLREVNIEMVAQAVCFVVGIFVVLFAAKGWVLTWY